MSIYFTNHFYFGSKINGINVSGKTVKEAKKELASELKNYKLTLQERGGKKEQISAADIDLKYKSGEEIEKLKAKQNAFAWITGKNKNLTEGISYDSNLLKKYMAKLNCITSNDIVEPKNPTLKYTDKGYQIVPEVKGNKVNKDKLYSSVKKAILNKETVLNLNSNSCYVNPKYTSKSKEVVSAKNQLNKYAASKITYTFPNSQEVIDGSVISNWINVTKNFKVSLDENKIQSYVYSIAYKHNTIGSTRHFVDASGKKIKVSGGDYGWALSTINTQKDLITNIKNGKTVTKDPIYRQTAKVVGKNGDIGDTYIEINIKKQHAWLYKNGSLVTDSKVVTGNVSLNDSTPTGVYYVKYKDKDAMLKGADYNTHVNYWMPFNGNVGLHDALWRSTFGGEIYKTNGSHGCVNAPLKFAKKVFENIDSGIPVVVH